MLEKRLTLRKKRLTFNIRQHLFFLKLPNFIKVNSPKDVYYRRNAELFFDKIGIGLVNTMTYYIR